MKEEVTEAIEELRKNFQESTLTVEDAEPMSLSLVARLYCSDSLGMFGDGPNRVESKTLISLFRTPMNERSIMIDRWGL